MKIVKMNFKIGERVRLSHRFLNSVQGDAELSAATGIVLSVKPIGDHNSHVMVKWSDGFTSGALASNLAHINFDITE
jgi:hypothetical protein